MKRFHEITKRVRNLFLIIIIALAQTLAAAGPFIKLPKVAAAPICINDTAGANDEPGQKDLTKLCVDEAGLPNTVAVTWNWDELGTSGANTMDGCALFDSDNDGYINYAACVTTTGTPAVYGSLTLYSCGDAKVDRCTTPNPTIAGPYSSTCSVNQQSTQPFAAGAGTPQDTVATCTFVLDDFNININDLELTDVCSYPSEQPNSDPSDCVIIQDRSGKLEVRKDLIPSDNSGVFNLQVDGVTKAANVGDNGTTGEVVVPEGNHSVGETAGTNTALASYSTAIECRDLNGTGSVIASGNGATLAAVSIADGADVVCIITNTAAGSITIVKDAVANSLQDFAFTTTGTGLSNFSLDDDTGVTGADNVLSNTRTFNNLSGGTYTITESATTGWDLASINCGNAAGVAINGGAVTINLTAGQNVTCTYRNEQRGQVIVTKQTNPDGDPTQFSVTATGTGNIAGNATRSISDNQSTTYDVAHGTYAVNEQIPNGWTQTSNNCSNLVINGNTPKVNGVPTLTCTIVNTKLVTITIIKDALPNNAQDFLFNIQRVEDNSAGSNFTLDDDGDNNNGIANSMQFANASPGTYNVTETAVPGWALTGASCNFGNSNLVGGTLSFTATAGQSITCTFTNTKLVSISGTKYTSSATGALGPVLSGWTIFIDANGNGVLDNGELSTVTDANGNYSFTDLMPGSFTLNEVLLAGWTQIFGPQTFNLNPGQDATDIDFGNFQNGGISGFKWNDLNGNGQYDNEPKLSGWTINLYRDSNDPDNVPDQLVSTTVTDQNGNYSFTNLSPLPNRYYAVCEVQQANWVQTYPTNNTCHMIELDQSGETNTNTNFGNQGRGGIQVVKNVDTDGDGDIDVFGATDWTWDINGSGNFATGSTQNVAAGNYNVSEDQKANFHVTASSCTGEATPNTPTTTLSVTLSPGETVICTFVNTRDTGTITVRKVVNPTTDPGLFNLRIDGQTAGTGANVGHGGGTGTIVVPTGTHSVSETAGTNTSLANYSSSFECSNNLDGSGTSTGNFQLTTGQNITCVFTNVRFGGIIVQKQTLPDGSAQSFTFTANYNQNGFSLSDGQSNNSGTLLPGNYSVSEVVPNGWDQTSAVCSDQSAVNAISLQAGETVTCVFTNTQRASISGTKYEVNAGATTGTVGNELQGWTIFIDANGNGTHDGGEVSDITDANGDYDFGNVVPGTYRICEVLQAGWTQVFPAGNPGCHTVVLDPGETAIGNDFGNFQNGSISGYKWNDLDGDGVHDANEPKLSDWLIIIREGNTVVDQKLTDANGNYSFTNLDPGTYTVCEAQQAGWVQTFPVLCHTIEINESGERGTAIFGNQGRGGITVVKNVDGNGDGDLNDAEDVLGATDWTWDLDGNYVDDANVATGATKSNIPADTYSIHEDQKANYHFVSVTCSGETVTQDETVTVTLSPGENITCTFVNARDTGRITVQKELVPDTDDGQFDLLVGATTVVTDAGDGDNGSLQVITGNYTVSELAGTETTLEDYDSDVSCTNGQTIVADDDTDATVAVGADDEWVCIFTNTRLGSVTIIKDSVPDSTTQSFNFTSDLTTDNGGNFTLTDIDFSAQLGSRAFTRLLPGEYNVDEVALEGWDLDSVNCDGGKDVTTTATGADIDLNPGENVICTFTNHQRATVIVTKYNDLNRNGEFDPEDATTPEEGLPGWTITLNTDEQVTGANGATTFANVKPNQLYSLGEVQQDGWNLSNITCDGGANELPTFADRLQLNLEAIDVLADDYLLFPEPGQTVTCFIGNYQDLVLNIAKANNRPNPTTVGDTVTYTLTVSVPEESGASFDTSTIDLPPENFTYVPGSWTANSSVRGDIKAAGVTTEPTYASPGTWLLGTLLPGEIVTLTYRAVIGNTVSAGTYPDVAFAQGCGLPGDPCIDEEVVFSNLSFASEPFVSTAVTIVGPQVLGANTTVLVNTGTRGMLASVMAAFTLLFATLLVARRRPITKGGRK
jgi:hypothetical protein